MSECFCYAVCVSFRLLFLACSPACLFFAFALAQNMPGKHADVFKSTTLGLCLFTTVVCGGMTAPLLTKTGMRRELPPGAVAPMRCERDVAKPRRLPMSRRSFESFASWLPKK